MPQFWKKLEDIITPWEAWLFLGLAYLAIDLPLSVAFAHHPTNLELVVELIVAMSFLADWIFYPPSYHGRTHKSFWVISDVLAAIPGLTIVAALGYRESQLMVYIQAIHLFRAPRLIETILSRVKHRIVPKRFKAMIAAYCTVLILNTFACGWMLVMPSSEDPVTAYNKALYWLITTIATVGYGDITPNSNIARIYAMSMMIMGATIWGILIASASRMMLASDRRKEQRKEKLAALQSMFDHYQIPKHVQAQVTDVYQHLLVQKVNDDERAVLTELPAALQQELQIYMNLKPISRVSIFQGVSFECLASAAKKLEQVFYSPGDVIIKAGDTGSEMFLIGHGSVTVHQGDKIIANLGDGACFGEFALIGEGKRTADVTASSYCDVFKLSKEKFDELFNTHIDLRKNIERIAAERQKQKSVMTPDTSRKAS